MSKKNKVFSVNYKYCPACFTVNDLDATECLNCKNVKLIFLPYSKEDLQNLWKDIKAYNTIGNIAFTHLMENRGQEFLPVTIVNLYLSVELSLKAEIIMNGNSFEESHSFLKLFNVLNKIRKKEIFDYLIQKTKVTQKGLNKFTQDLNECFTKMRYIQFDCLNKLDFFVGQDFVDNLKHLSDFLSVPPNVYCDSIYCRDIHNEDKCLTCTLFTNSKK